MTLKARSLGTINDLRDFLEEEGIGRGDMTYFGNDFSGNHVVIYGASSSGAASLKSGSTPEERAVHHEQGVAAPLNATQVTSDGTTTLTFDADAGTLTRASGSWLADGFLPGTQITVAGTSNNDGTYYVEEATASVLTIKSDASSALHSSFSDSFVDEGPLSGGETVDGEQWGYEVGGSPTVHVVVKLPDSATSLDWELYTYDSASQEWTLDTRPGTDGVVSMVSGDSPARTILELPGVEKVALKISNLSGTFTTGYSAWLVGGG